MSLLDRYIARQYLTNVIVLLVILFCFVVAVDVSINLSRFAKIADRLGAQGEVPPDGIRKALVTVLVIFDLWWPRLLQLFNFLLGIILVGAMGFTCSQLVRNREFIAMLSAGQSLHRVARPLLIVAGGLTIVQAVNQELIVPRIAPLLVREHNQAGSRDLSSAEVPLIADGSGRVLRAASFDPASGALTDLFVIERDGQGRATRVIRADGATYDEDAKLWQLDNGRSEPRGLITDPSAPGQPGTIAQQVPVETLTTSIDPTRLRMERFRSYQNALSFSQVSAMLARKDLLDDDDRAQLERIRWGRFAVLISNFLSLIIVMPFFVTRVPENMVLQSLKCAPIAVVSLMGGVLGASAELPGLPPALGVFVPTLILIPVGIATLTSVRT
ncbi:MAG: LptF/LptG family permease [Planctomycetota bacterium]